MDTDYVVRRSGVFSSNPWPDSPRMTGSAEASKGKQARQMRWNDDLKNVEDAPASSPCIGSRSLPPGKLLMRMQSAKGTISRKAREIRPSTKPVSATEPSSSNCMPQRPSSREARTSKEAKTTKEAKRRTGTTAGTTSAAFLSAFASAADSGLLGDGHDEFVSQYQTHRFANVVQQVLMRNLMSKGGSAGETLTDLRWVLSMEGADSDLSWLTMMNAAPEKFAIMREEIEGSKVPGQRDTETSYLTELYKPEELKGRLLPFSLFRMCWDIMMFLLVLYTAITLPLFLTILEDDALSIPTRYVMGSLDIAMDVIFLVDIVLNFLTAYVRDGQLVIDRRLIARDYLVPPSPPRRAFMPRAPRGVHALPYTAALLRRIHGC